LARGQIDEVSGYSIAPWAARQFTADHVDRLHEHQFGRRGRTPSSVLAGVCT
jgi:hypothetical protein